MSKLTPAASNVRATTAGGLRTGYSEQRQHVSPVAIFVGPGNTAMPHTLDGIKPVPHPEPSTINPTDTKVAAARAAVAARAATNAKRRAQRAARKSTGPVLRKLPKGRGIRKFAEQLCAKLAAGTQHSLKVVESKVDINGGPSYNVFMRLAGQSRGKHVFTLYCNHPSN